MRRRQKKVDERRLIVGLIAILLILLGVLLHTVIIPMIINVDFFPEKEKMVKPNLQNNATTSIKNVDVPLPSASTTTKNNQSEISEGYFEYVEVIDSCGPHHEGECLRVRSGPSTDYPVVNRLRNGMVLKIGKKVETDGVLWYEIIFDEWLRYPNRFSGEWYVVADYVKVLVDEGEKTTWDNEYSTTTKKSIVVDRSEQKVYAYDGEDLFMIATTSTGLALTPTPRGTFTVFKKTPSRYMQGPLPNLADQSYYDLPGVPWNLYFTDGGAVIHGAYWHDSFGSRYSHGCVNLPTDVARTLYLWADLGTKVIVRD